MRKTNGTTAQQQQGTALRSNMDSLCVGMLPIKHSGSCVWYRPERLVSPFLGLTDWDPGVSSPRDVLREVSALKSFAQRFGIAEARLFKISMMKTTLRPIHGERPRKFGSSTRADSYFEGWTAATTYFESRLLFWSSRPGDSYDTNSYHVKRARGSPSHIRAKIICSVFVLGSERLGSPKSRWGERWHVR